jgi:hypothetical protein
MNRCLVAPISKADSPDKKSSQLGRAFIESIDISVSDVDHRNSLG